MCLLPHGVVLQSGENIIFQLIIGVAFFVFLQMKVQIRRHPMQELPETADGIAQWCKDIFITKVREHWFFNIIVEMFVLDFRGCWKIL